MKLIQFMAGAANQEMSHDGNNRKNEYGTFYQVVGELVGENGVILSVVTIGLQRPIDEKFQFVTLKPIKEN